MTNSGELWRNWGRNQQVRPRRVERPSSAGAVQRAVVAAAAAGLNVKAVGAGHSFSGIALAPHVQLDLHDLRGLVDVDAATGRVTLGAGTRLRDIPALLAPWSLALENLGDIDRQTIAGAISTGTHGTGGGFGGLATQVVGLQMVTGDGSLLTVAPNRNPELLPAVRLGLGALGVIVEVTLQCVPAFALHAVERAEPLEQVAADYLDRSAHADHFEFYWFPHTTVALTKTNTRLPPGAPLVPRPLASRLIDDELLANGAYRLTCSVGAMVPALVPRLNRLAAAGSGRREFTDASHRVFVSHRAVRFREMEYALPRAAVPEALREVRRVIDARGWRISFPLEVRSAAADDLWMSTARGRETGYIAVRRYFREDPRAYFQAVEDIMRAHDGRPHWGKEHGLGAADFRKLYPRFDDFLAVRDRLDPDRRFGNPYLETVLGP